MKEILKSKLMLGFILFIMGVCYINIQMNNEVNMEDNDLNNTVVLNK